MFLLLKKKKKSNIAKWKENSEYLVWFDKKNTDSGCLLLSLIDS